MKHTVAIREKEFSVNFSEVNFMKRYQVAEKEMLKSLAEAGKGLSENNGVEVLVRQGAAMLLFVDNVFGKGTKDLFGDKVDLDELFSLYITLKSVFAEQAASLTDKIVSLIPQTGSGDGTLN